MSEPNDLTNVISTATVDGCPFCDRTCPRCRYTIPAGFVHVPQPQKPTSNVVVCSAEQYRGPATSVIDDYLSHRQHSAGAIVDELTKITHRLLGWGSAYRNPADVTACVPMGELGALAERLLNLRERVATADAVSDEDASAL